MDSLLDCSSLHLSSVMAVQAVCPKQDAPEYGRRRLRRSVSQPHLAGRTQGGSWAKLGVGRFLYGVMLLLPGRVTILPQRREQSSACWALSMAQVPEPRPAPCRISVMLGHELLQSTWLGRMRDSSALFRVCHVHRRTHLLHCFLVLFVIKGRSSSSSTCFLSAGVSQHLLHIVIPVR
jgi:hypothetical protein